MTNVNNIKHPNTNEEVLRNLRGRSNHKKHQEWFKQGCLLLAQAVFTVSFACGVGSVLAHKGLLDTPAQATANSICELAK